MPGYDRTGPFGRGPLSGRGLGPCRRGLAFRRGFGRGYGRYAEPVAQYSESVTLSKDEQIKILEAEKQEIERKLDELKK